VVPTPEPRVGPEDVPTEGVLVLFCRVDVADGTLCPPSGLLNTEVVPGRVFAELLP
jgi:hypothetical protein